jgi:hypothetical protein
MLSKTLERAKGSQDWGEEEEIGSVPWSKRRAAFSVAQ